MRLKKEFANVETNLMFITTKNLKTECHNGKKLLQWSVAEEGEPLGPASSPECVMSLGVGAMLHNCCLPGFCEWDGGGVGEGGYVTA